MSVIVVLIGLSLSVAGAFLIAFLWAVRSGQYDDNDTPPMRMLFDDPMSKGSITHPSPNETEEHGERTVQLR